MGPDQARVGKKRWKACDHWLEDQRVDFLDKPGGLETSFRGLTRSPNASPKDWADWYLATFALASRLALVAFDRAFESKAKDLVLLEA